MNTTCHFCDGEHPLDAAGALLCRPKRRFKSAFEAALGAPPHRQVEVLLGRVVFLGERPNPEFVRSLLERIARDGWPA
ncbi:MAG: hypothetical protein RMM58_05155 [Chloroflexota bacterium]|nr:hypothetical protein [Dehalococcoidia bacterium]MDW8253250.1 hypothetical protein [Chloroflexota bacterium]